MAARKLEKYLTRQFEERVSRESVECEQKYRVARVDTIRKRLVKLGAHAHASRFERNELFDCSDRLRDQGFKLRLRCHGGKIARLTLKGPRKTGSQKIRMEVETAVEYEPAKGILELRFSGEGNLLQGARGISPRWLCHLPRSHSNGRLVC